jgi:Zn-dependent M28 family amino/carboxypeptidase
MKLKLSVSLKPKATFNKSYNVIGKVTGTTLPDEYVIYTAHWDHLGIGKPDETGDSIYNGALDNASGTAGLLELATAFASLKEKPARTTVFLAVTAEEQGLLGSAWYANNPVYPIEKTVANINMDGLNWFEKTNDIVVVGSGQSELEDYLKEEAQKKNRYLSPEPTPSAGYYFRSDHFNFAKVGIPALYTDNGIDIPGKGKDYGKNKNQEYTDKFYHRPSDEYEPAAWNLDGAVEDLNLLFAVGKRVATQSEWPKWKPASEFKDIRK